MLSQVSQLETCPLPRSALQQRSLRSSADAQEGARASAIAHALATMLASAAVDKPAALWSAVVMCVVEVELWAGWLSPDQVAAVTTMAGKVNKPLIERDLVASTCQLARSLDVVLAGKIGMPELKSDLRRPVGDASPPVPDDGQALVLLVGVATGRPMPVLMACMS